MHKCFILLLVFASLHAAAQDSLQAKNRAAYFSINQAIHYEGSSGSAFGVQTIHGVSYRGWALGAGVGIDGYRVRSVPVLLHLSRALPIRRIPVFVYAEGGPNFFWDRKEEGWFWGNKERDKGYHWDAGLQYRAPLRNKTFLVFGAGFSEKIYSETFTSPVWCGTPDCPTMTNRFDYKFRRLALKAGFGF
ncbi:hypothetical protein [Pseudocnuella soli]|uniref:hypothetical protein n=1 Tax=Pseudocnuella soli TaxID=2502779 RepID=UPI00104AC48F|nr:hypothetical protein [Pseudocnuella soli]